MKTKDYNPYKIDIKYEYRTYRYIGRDYGDRKSANIGVIDNLIRCLRKEVNKNENYYATCNTYTEWYMHMKTIIPSGKNNSKNMLYWLRKNQKAAKHYLEAIKVVLVPIYIALISIFDIFSDEKRKLEGLIIILIMVVLSTFILMKASIKKEFFDDITDIIQEIITERQEDCCEHKNNNS